MMRRPCMFVFAVALAASLPVLVARAQPSSTPPPTPQCKITEASQGLSPGSVAVWGDLEIRMMGFNMNPGNTPADASIDIKAPGFDVRGLKIVEYNLYTYSNVCGKEVTVTMGPVYNDGAFIHVGVF